MFITLQRLGRLISVKDEDFHESSQLLSTQYTDKIFLLKYFIFLLI